MPLKFAVVCESVADFRTAKQLAERIFIEQIEWLEQEDLELCPLWCEIEPGECFLRWDKTPGLAKRLHIKPRRGKFQEEAAKDDAFATRRALLVLEELLADDLDGILLIRDDDRKTERRAGLEQARSESAFSDRIVIGLAHRNRECWLLAGYEIENEAEQEKLNELKKTLSFDPTLQPQRLNGRNNQPRDPKRVLRELTKSDPERESRCLAAVELKTVGDRGKTTGLSDFIEELETRLVPRFGAGSA